VNLIISCPAYLFLWLAFGELSNLANLLHFFTFILDKAKKSDRSFKQGIGDHLYIGEKFSNRTDSHRLITPATVLSGYPL
jgi:hypothetical protein